MNYDRYGQDLAKVLAGPSGLGTAACRLPAPPELVPTDLPAPLPYIEREWGDGSYPLRYCPPTVRIDDGLAEEVNRRLVAWAEKVGLHAGRVGKFRDTGFGRLAMFTHPDTDDPDLLLVAAQMNAAWWAADDYYADETPLGATPTDLPPRLALGDFGHGPARRPTPAGHSARRSADRRHDPVRRRGGHPLRQNRAQPQITVGPVLIRYLARNRNSDRRRP